MDGHTIGVFGTDKEQKARFMASIAKKSEVEGMIVYHKNEAGKRYSFLDDPAYPERVQGYSRIASICDYALYLLPKGGKLSPPDGELAVLLESYGLPGTVEIVDGQYPGAHFRISMPIRAAGGEPDHSESNAHAHAA